MLLMSPNALFSSFTAHSLYNAKYLEREQLVNMCSKRLTLLPPALVLYLGTTLQLAEKPEFFEGDGLQAVRK